MPTAVDQPLFRSTDEAQLVRCVSAVSAFPKWILWPARLTASRLRGARGRRIEMGLLWPVMFSVARRLANLASPALG